MSKLSITFQFDSEAEAQGFLAKLTFPTEGLKAEVAVEKPARIRMRRAAAKQPDAPVTLNIGAATAGTSPTKLQGDVPVPPAPVAAPVPASVTSTPTPDIAPVPKAPTDAPTQEDVRTALRTVFNTKGAGTATELLKKFGATSVGTVKPEQFVDFIKACQ